MNRQTTERRQQRAMLPGLLGLALTMALSASAIAAPGHDRRPGPPGIPPELDSNGDATLSRSEFEAGASRHFIEVDQNGDGQVTLEELVAGEQARRERDEARHQREQFERMDANADGAIDSVEFSAMAAGHFDEMDGNGDGVVDATEWHPPGPPPPPRGAPEAPRAGKARR